MFLPICFLPAPKNQTMPSRNDNTDANIWTGQLINCGYYPWVSPNPSEKLVPLPFVATSALFTMTLSFMFAVVLIAVNISVGIRREYLYAVASLYLVVILLCTSATGWLSDFHTYAYGNDNSVTDDDGSRSKKQNIDTTEHHTWVGSDFPLFMLFCSFSNRAQAGFMESVLVVNWDPRSEVTY